jgi:hypothetical protein
MSPSNSVKVIRKGACPKGKVQLSLYYNSKVLDPALQAFFVKAKSKQLQRLTIKRKQLIAINRLIFAINCN